MIKNDTENIFNKKIIRLQRCCYNLYLGISSEEAIAEGS